MELAQILNTFKPFLLYLCNVIVKIKRLQYCLVASLVGCIFGFEVVENVADTQTVTTDLVRIGRTNTLARGAYLVLALLSLVGGIKNAMGRHDKMSLLGNMQARLQLMAAGLQSFCLVHEKVGSQNDSITYNVHFATLEDS